ncbi:MAG: kinase [Sphingomonadales bacterium]|nr:kinase [Sphingomonadales bacterium]
MTFRPPVAPDPALLDAALALIRERRGAGLFIFGLCGAQGSGKSTLARALVAALTARGKRAAALSLDDLYLTHAERAGLGRSVHPLFATRGVPGTHDIPLGLALFDALARGEPAALPRFSNAADDRLPPAEWPHAPAGLEVLVFEGWCVGARPQDEAALAVPVNDLERMEDADARWRTHANTCLGGPYQRLFARLDALMLLAAPSFAVIARWRLEQEQDLAPGARMDAAAVARFVGFYERLTRHMLAEMPARADLVAPLDEMRRPVTLTQAGR